MRAIKVGAAITVGLTYWWWMRAWRAYNKAEHDMDVYMARRGIG